MEKIDRFFNRILTEQINIDLDASFINKTYYYPKLLTNKYFDINSFLDTDETVELVEDKNMAKAFASTETKRDLSLVIEFKVKTDRYVNVEGDLLETFYRHDMTERDIRNYIFQQGYFAFDFYKKVYNSNVKYLICINLSDIAKPVAYHIKHYDKWKVFNSFNEAQKFIDNFFEMQVSWK